MTVIVFRDGVMAADSAVWQGDIIAGYRRKIRRLPDGSLFASCGRQSHGDACFQWLSEHAGDPDKRPPADEEKMFGALIITTSGVMKIEHDMRVFAAIPAPYYVEGAHLEFLHGALTMGATAEEAVRLAIQFGDSAAGEVQVERL